MGFLGDSFVFGRYLLDLGCWQGGIYNSLYYVVYQMANQSDKISSSGTRSIRLRSPLGIKCSQVPKIRIAEIYK